MEKPVVLHAAGQVDIALESAHQYAYFQLLELLYHVHDDDLEPPPTHCRHEQIFILLASALIAGVAALFASAAAGLHLEGAHYLA